MNDFRSRIFLYSMPSFLKGIARLADFSNQLDEYNRSSTPEEADYLALLSDWLSVGDDLQNAIMEYEKELHNMES